MTSEHRFVVGIDLGTTNSAVSFVDLTASDGGRPVIRKFPVHQLTGPGEFAALPVLPSFLYIPGEYDIADQDRAAPWTIDQRSRDDQNFAGAFARDHGAKVPARLVSSAKSWLCNKQVDTRARILPWGAGEEVVKVSPVHASAAFLKHVRKAWNVAMGDAEEDYLERQAVIVTIPASFDEVARDLTLEAARLAGLPDVILLEEPLAAFYSWLIRHETDWPDHVAPGQLILVCDVGGGTTDFTLISLRDVDGSPRFERIAVGDHLILGGDNMDFAIARSVARRLGKSPAAMGRDAWKTLCHQCRQAKEKILDGITDSGRITLMGSGSSLIAGTLTARVDRREIEAIVLDQFFPLSGTCSDTETPDGNASWGLPYEADTAVTGHLVRFLDRHRADVSAAVGKPVPCPDLILFNGGALKSRVVQNRVREAVGRWFSSDSKATVLHNREMDLAVSLGAAYYGMVKSGIGVRVGSGSPRSFYIGVAAGNDQGQDGKKKAVCLVERGLEEGSAIALPDRAFKVLANQPVSIDLFSSSFRSGDRSGDLVDVDDTLTALPALNTVIQFGDKGVRSEIAVGLEATYTEAGTLEVWCRSRATSHRWQLRFQLRGAETPDAVAETDVFEAGRIDAARQVVLSAFSPDGDPSRLPRLISDIAEAIHCPRDRWPLGLLRDLADTLLDDMAARTLSPVAESRWMNLLGFCLRPGMGEGFDPHRVKRLWKIYKKGPVHANAPQVRAEWWIMWRRVAAGLTPGQQRQFFQDLYPALVVKKGSRVSRQEFTEIWMATASMERLHVNDKITLGRQLIRQFKAKKPQPQLLWALARIGARDLLYGSIDRVAPPAEVGGWVETILGRTWKNPKPVAEMLSQLCRKTGDPLRDIPVTISGQAAGWMDAAGDFPDQVARITRQSARKQKERNTIFGESLPAGLVMEDR
ncbi:heat-shock protein [Desulfosarcina alkanivorans]|uniref:Heat-shock protein n=1 Tax=Desulfosarcina alkanivorans TaxID=571177 RepID=A0A5K7YEU4_9BACT|nr:hsp70 family protein [Desulfosarcina alkanivorans]BBO66965.1 heat-shock protein [Desulfosarcina alkanivorans]